MCRFFSHRRNDIPKYPPHTAQAETVYYGSQRPGSEVVVARMRLAGAQYGLTFPHPDSADSVDHEHT